MDNIIGFLFYFILPGFAILLLIWTAFAYYRIFLEDKIYEWKRKRLIKKLKEMPTWDETCINLLKNLSKKEDKDDGD